MIIRWVGFHPPAVAPVSGVLRKPNTRGKNLWHPAYKTKHRFYIYGLRTCLGTRSEPKCFQNPLQWCQVSVWPLFELLMQRRATDGGKQGGIVVLEVRRVRHLFILSVSCWNMCPNLFTVHRSSTGHDVTDILGIGAARHSRPPCLFSDVHLAYWQGGVSGWGSWQWRDLSYQTVNNDVNDDWKDVLQGDIPTTAGCMRSYDVTVHFLPHRADYGSSLKTPDPRTHTSHPALWPSSALSSDDISWFTPR